MRVHRVCAIFVARPDVGAARSAFDRSRRAAFSGKARVCTADLQASGDVASAAAGKTVWADAGMLKSTPRAIPSNRVAVRVLASRS